MDGSYTLESSQPIDPAALEAVSHFFSVDLTTLTTPTSREASQISGLFYVFLMALGILVLLIMLISMMQPLSSIKNISAKKLLGWKNRDIWLSSLKGVGLLAAVVFALLAAGSLLIPGTTLGFFAGLMAVAAAVLVFMLVVSALSFLAVVRFKTSDALKGRFPLRIPLVGSLVLKVLFAGCMAFSTASVAQTGSSVLRDYQRQSQWAREGGLSVVSHYETRGDDLASITGGNAKLDEKFASLYDDLNDKMGAIYARAEDCPRLSSFAGSYRTLTVNPNYLKKNPIKDTQGKPFDFPESESNLIILIPASRAGDKDKFVNQVKKDRAFENESARNRPGSHWPDSPAASNSSDAQKLVVSSYLYDDSAPFFSFNDRVGADSGYLIKSPLVVVATEANIAPSAKWDLSVTGVDDPLKLPISSAADKETFSQIVYAHGFSPDQFHLSTLNDAIASETAEVQLSLEVLVAAFAAVLMLSVVSSYVLARVVLTARLQRLSVARMLGYRLVDRHGTETIALAGLYAVALVVLWLATQDVASVLLMLAVALIDLVISLLAMGHLEKRSVVTILKGGS